MELVLDFAVFALGIALGMTIMYLRSRSAAGPKLAKEQLNACQQENAQLKQNWQDHIAEYRSIARNLQEMSHHIELQIDDAEQIIRPQEQSPAFPFFSKEATHILKNANRKPRSKTTTDNQPLDYSGKASGVFSGESADPIPSKMN